MTRPALPFVDVERRHDSVVEAVARRRRRGDGVVFQLPHRRGRGVARRRRRNDCVVWQLPDSRERRRALRNIVRVNHAHALWRFAFCAGVGYGGPNFKIFLSFEMSQDVKEQHIKLAEQGQELSFCRKRSSTTKICPSVRVCEHADAGSAARSSKCTSARTFALRHCSSRLGVPARGLHLKRHSARLCSESAPNEENAGAGCHYSTTPGAAAVARAAEALWWSL